MKVILCEDVDNVGDMGETVKVSDGYGRNFLLPRRMAVAADTASAKQIEHEMAIIRRRDEKRRKALGEVAGLLGAVTVEIEMRAGEQQKLYGSVTSAMITDALHEQGYTTISKKQVKLSEPINALGVYSVPVRLASGIEPEIKVHVTPEEVTEDEAAKQAAAEAAAADEAESEFGGAAQDDD